MDRKNYAFAQLCRWTGVPGDHKQHAGRTWPSAAPGVVGRQPTSGLIAPGRGPVCHRGRRGGGGGGRKGGETHALP